MMQSVPYTAIILTSKTFSYVYAANFVLLILTCCRVRYGKATICPGNRQCTYTEGETHPASVCVVILGVSLV